jgi:hypothetical protein
MLFALWDFDTVVTIYPPERSDPQRSLARPLGAIPSS